MFFFFKQKTAYEVRIIDWSSDVCSSDLLYRPDARVRRPQTQRAPPGGRVVRARLKEGVDGAPDKGEPSAYSPTLRRNTGPLKSRSSAWRGRVTIRCARRNCVTTRSSPFCSLPINFRKRIRLLAFIFSSSLPLLVTLVSCRRYVLKNSRSEEH